jgi:hypothetical protein
MGASVGSARLSRTSWSHRRLGDFSEHADATAATGAGEHVDFEGAAEQSCPVDSGEAAYSKLPSTRLQWMLGVSSVASTSGARSPGAEAWNARTRVAEVRSLRADAPDPRAVVAGAMVSASRGSASVLGGPSRWGRLLSFVSRACFSRATAPRRTQRERPGRPSAAIGPRKHNGQNFSSPRCRNESGKSR